MQVELLGLSESSLWEKFEGTVYLMQIIILAYNLKVFETKQTNWWAMAARLQNARVTATDFSWPVASLDTKPTAEKLVIANSSDVRMLLVDG